MARGFLQKKDRSISVFLFLPPIFFSFAVFAYIFKFLLLLRFVTSVVACVSSLCFFSSFFFQHHFLSFSFFPVIFGSVEKKVFGVRIKRKNAHFPFQGDSNRSRPAWND